MTILRYFFITILVVAGQGTHLAGSQVQRTVEAQLKTDVETSVAVCLGVLSKPICVKPLHSLTRNEAAARLRLLTSSEVQIQTTPLFNESSSSSSESSYARATGSEGLSSRKCGKTVKHVLPSMQYRAKALALSKQKQESEKISKEMRMASVLKKDACVQREYLDFDDTLVGDCTGCFDYYKEYHAYSVKKGLVSFSVACCDPLPLQTAEDGSKYFFPSHVEGGWPVGAVEVTNPHLTQIRVVRAKSAYVRTQVYLGYDPTDYKLVGYKGSKKIYHAKILMIQTKHIDSVEIRQYFSPLPDAQWLSLSKPQVGKKLVSSTIYWTATENKLKGFFYGKH